MLRLRCWENIINECTKISISELKTQTKSFDSLIHKLQTTFNNKLFKCKPSKEDMNIFLSYLMKWEGLNTKLIECNNKPSSFKHYEKKSKNWANGARAREYSKKLYPFMIKSMQNYINTTILSLITDLSKDDKLRLKCFSKSVAYLCLIQLCQSSVTIPNGKRKVLLLCENSLKKHKSNKTCAILQSYVTNHEYISNFPAHRQEAIDFYTTQKDKYLLQSIQSIKSIQSIQSTQLRDYHHKSINVEYFESITSKPISITCQYEDVMQLFINNQETENKLNNIPKIMNYIKKHYKNEKDNKIMLHPQVRKLIANISYQLQQKEIQNKININKLEQKIKDLEDQQRDKEDNQIRNNMINMNKINPIKSNNNKEVFASLEPMKKRRKLSVNDNCNDDLNPFHQKSIYEPWDIDYNSENDNYAFKMMYDQSSVHQF